MDADLVEYYANIGVNIVEDMEYVDENDKKIICNGFYKKYYFEIMSYGTHPAAYVTIDNSNNKIYEKDYEDLDFIKCHGGLTYSEFDEYDATNWVIGWDYAHKDDYVLRPHPSYGSEIIDEIIFGDWGSDNGKKYHVDDILKDVFNVINQIIKFNVEGE